MKWNNWFLARGVRLSSQWMLVETLQDPQLKSYNLFLTSLRHFNPKLETFNRQQVCHS